MSSAAPALQPDINAYVIEHGRLPLIGEPIQPWEYRGWLLYYVQLADSHPGLSHRWQYYLDTREAGKLLDAPIPQVHFGGHGPEHALARKNLERWENRVHEESGSWSSMRGVIEWLAFGLAVSTEPPKFTAKLNEWLYRNVDLGPMLLAPSDYIGEHLASNDYGKRSGFFPTPHEICELMTRMTMHDIGATLPDGRDSRLATVCDPCVGTGRMLLHASNLSLCLYGMDIDGLVAMAARVNAALYVPWLAFPLPEAIVGALHPDPPPAPLPVGPEHFPADGAPVYRVDDRGQGLLFDLGEPKKLRPARPSPFLRPGKMPKNKC